MERKTEENPTTDIWQNLEPENYEEDAYLGTIDFVAREKQVSEKVKYIIEELPQLYKYPCSSVCRFLKEEPLSQCYDPVDDDIGIRLTAKVNFIDYPHDRSTSFLFFIEYDSRLEESFESCELK